MTETTDTAPVRQELERVKATPAQRNLVGLIRGNRPELEKALGGALTVAQFETAAMTYLRLQPKLYECNPFSVVGGLRLGAQLGLSLGPLGHFYLVPHKGEAVFIIGYRGMVELAYRSGQVKDVKAVLVREGDAFDYREGTRPFLDHTPSGPPGEREITHAYAVARLRSGGTPFVVTYPDDWKHAQAKSAAGAKGVGPWATDWPAMVRKTAVRRLQPWLPQTQALALAAQRDEDVVTDLTDDAEGGIEA